MTKLHKSIGLILLIVLTACSQKISFSFEILTPVAPSTATAPESVAGQDLATPTPWVAGTQTALAVTEFPTSVPPLPTISFPTQEKPTDFSPVLYGGNRYGNTFFLLLGGVGRNTWFTPAESVARFGGEMTYSLHTLTVASKYFFWGEVPNFSPTCKSYFINTDADVDEANFTGVMDGWNTTKHEVTGLTDNGLFYQQAVLDWLKAEEVAKPQIGTLRVFRVDLEGDGSDEIFISATHLDESQHTTQAGDYSIILMRKVIGNEALTVPLVADFYISKGSEITYPRTYSLVNFIDLNQDGVMEVVVDIQKWEGFGAIVYQINGQNVNQTLRAEC